MEGLSLKSRAIAFALSCGAFVFILALFAGSGKAGGEDGVVLALVMAIVCGVMSWGAAERTIAGTAEAVDAVADRMIAAAAGDLTSGTPVVVTQAMPDLSIAMDTLFSQFRANLDSVHALAMFDPVTGLPNRINFRREADRLLATMPEDQRTALMFIDLDRFKEVNDSLGHAAGDELLVMVSNRLRGLFKGVERDPPPIVARLGGDEFTLLCPATGDRDDAGRLARRALHALAEPFQIVGQRLDIGASIGVALHPEDGRDLPALMRAADIAMYRAKSEGRGQICVFDPSLLEAFEQRLRLDREMRLALQRDEFELAFQPQVRMSDGQTVAIEGLIRWNHPSGAVKLPGSFIHVAEDSGLIHDIGRWVIAAALRELGIWRGRGIAHRMSINVSPRQIERPEFFTHLRETIAETGADPAQLEIELTETVAMRCSPAVLEGIAALRADGVVIAIDDFGTGYSNMARLTALPIDRVKLDRSLIEDVVTRQDARTLVHSVIHLLHALGLEVVAEGVEQQAQVDVLRIIGCDTVQGYAVTPPLDAASLHDWLGRAEDQATAEPISA
jgi:diguanylate cyclase (GGDEF)-like protein